MTKNITHFFNVDPKNLKYIAYVRKSTEESDRQAMSIEAQMDAIKKQFPGLKIKFIKESMSAAKPGRELFNKMIDDVEAGKYQGIIAWHPDRLSRNAPDASRIILLSTLAVTANAILLGKLVLIVPVITSALGF